MKSLSKVEQAMCEKFDLVIIPGKRKVVPVILPPCMAAALSTLIDAKYDLKLKSDFIFCNPDSKSELLKPLRAWDLITKYAGKAGLKNPEVMTSTNFRKYTATVAQIVNLDENEL